MPALPGNNDHNPSRRGADDHHHDAPYDWSYDDDLAGSYDDGGNDHIVRPDNLHNGAIEFHFDIDIGAVNVYHRGAVYKLVLAVNFDHLPDDPTAGSASAGANL